MNLPAADAIPHPPGLPFVGSLFAIDRHRPIASITRLAARYGPIFRLPILGRNALILSSQELVDDACDQTRFDKLLSAGLTQLRRFAGDGLFTSRTDEPNWHKAHTILLPTFGGAALRGYLPQMLDIADQLVLKWERLNPGEIVHVTEDMTRLTLDTIGLCGFDYRFNSFYRDSGHPFVEAMLRAMGESLLRANRPPLLDRFLWRRRRQFARDVALMNEEVDRVIQRRRADPQAMADKHDLLGHMLTGVDRQTGTGLDDENIRYQIITFLIAGHETTSGLLSFALAALLKNPEVLRKARAEADAVFADYPGSPPTHTQVQRLVYVHQVLKETLRLWPTAPAFSLGARADTLLAGRYPVLQGQPLLVLLPALHRDPAVWGPNADAFNPDHFTPERESRRPPNAYKPFGNGRRACIGQQFALQEAALVLGMLLRRFEFIDHANYQVRVKEALTIKPEGFTIQIRPRRLARSPAVRPTAPATAAAETTMPAAVGEGTPLLVLYGSNLGTAEGLARRIAEDGRARGFATRVAPLDDVVGALPRDGAVVLVSASYNGTPPDNAGRFCSWLAAPPNPGELAGVRYAVFGCGDHNWSTTYQAVPRRIDEALAARGARRLHERGEGDAADDFDGQFSAWYRPLWGQIARAFGLAEAATVATTPAGFRVEPTTAEATAPPRTGFAAAALTVVVNRELQQGLSTRSTRHLELRLPEGVVYSAGDHLGVLPRNRADLVGRVVARFHLDGTARVILRKDGATGPSPFPIDTPVRLDDLLCRFFEFQEPATREQVQTLADRTACPPEKARLLGLVAKHREEVFDRRVSVLDLLEAAPACELTFGEYLGMLTPLRPRYYSISSSPLVAERVASITVGVVRDAARSGRGTYEGVASAYLAAQQAGAEVFGFVRGPGTPFRPPQDPRTPMILVGAGTGLAPFRGFLQERDAVRRQGHAVGPSLLFFGCRTPEQDYLYRDELGTFEAEGVTRVVPAFSRVAGQPKVYVQDAVAGNADLVWELLAAGAHVYVCGDAARMAPAVRTAFGGVFKAKTGTEPEPWLQELRTAGRYVEDVWASS